MAQFVIVPPLEKVAALFSATTGQRFTAGVSWKEWVSVPTDTYVWLRGYIRPCHQSVLNETIAGKLPLVLLRQILRPHDYYIDADAGSWSLRHGKPIRQVVVREGKTITWST